jgi:hypothetical protein
MCIVAHSSSLAFSVSPQCRATFLHNKIIEMVLGNLCPNNVLILNLQSSAVNPLAGGKDD